MAHERFIVTQISPRRWATCELNFESGPDRMVAVYKLVTTHDTEGVAIKQCRELNDEYREKFISSPPDQTEEWKDWRANGY